MSDNIKNRQIVIMGNSGSGKTTLARKIASQYSLPVLDLDTLAWLDTVPPERKNITDSKREMTQFMELNQQWIVEGCYADLLEIACIFGNELIFLNPGVAQCVANCKRRPWEPNKYKTAKEQDENLAMLINWVEQYSIRKDEFSLHSHQLVFENFSGKKTEIN